MRSILVATTLVLGAGSLLSVSRTAFGGEEAAARDKPVLVLTGADSRIDLLAFRRIASKNAWEKPWLARLAKTESDLYRRVALVNTSFLGATGGTPPVSSICLCSG